MVWYGGTVPIRSWTRTLRLPGIRHRHLPYHTIPYQSPVTLGQGTFGTWYILPSTSMADSVTGLRYAECSRAPDYITNEYGSPMQTTNCVI